MGYSVHAYSISKVVYEKGQPDSVCLSVFLVMINLCMYVR